MDSFNSLESYQSFGLNKDLTLKSELRHLSVKDRTQLAALLDVNQNWKRLAAIIPKPDEGVGPLITTGNMSTLEELFYRGISPTEALLDYWGTCGRKRATIEDLIKLLNSCHLYRASLYLCKDLLKIESFDEYSDIKCDNDFNEESIDQLMSQLNLNLSTGYEKYFNCDKFDPFSSQFNNTVITNDNSSEKTTDNNFVEPSAPNESLISFSSLNLDERQLISNPELDHYSYEQIRCATNDFSDVSVADGGHKLGEGAFGAVYRCQLPNDSVQIAVKKLKNDFQKQFISELKVLSSFRHPNLLPFRGISSDGPSLIIIYDYMANGSLQDCLEHNPTALEWSQRFSIALGMAKGICHLHTYLDKPYVHRDIKSANILLDHNMNARVGDFGLVRIGSGAGTTTKPLATSVFGTSIYMAPEAFRGDISVKLDSFSFGVVLLELITGLKPYDEDREGFDILSYIDDKISDLEDEDDVNAVVNTVIDKSVGRLDDEIATRLWLLSRKCTEQRKKLRPTMTEVLESLQQN